MELLYFELKARSAPNIVGFFVCLLATACISYFVVHSSDASTKVVAGLFATFFAFGCCTYIYSFVTNPNCEFGIRDDTIWWNSPGWRRSVGTIAIDQIRTVRVLEGPSKLHVIMRDGTSLRIPCTAVWNLERARELRDVLVAN